MRAVALSLRRHGRRAARLLVRSASEEMKCYSISMAAYSYAASNPNWSCRRRAFRCALSRRDRHAWRQISERIVDRVLRQTNACFRLSRFELEELAGEARIVSRLKDRTGLHDRLDPAWRLERLRRGDRRPRQLNRGEQPPYDGGRSDVQYLARGGNAHD